MKNKHIEVMEQFIDEWTPLLNATQAKELRAVVEKGKKGDVVMTLRRVQRQISDYAGDFDNACINTMLELTMKGGIYKDEDEG